ncbi:MAG: hypothetical protein HY537_15770 [Deltaproteobacteria bacterium]|nr:hypothetical protein [Deltaproteobacteria bacterium]
MEAAQKLPAAILIDDDVWIREAWKLKARERGRVIHVYATPDEFLQDVSGISNETPIFIDSNLGDGIRGEKLAEDLDNKGYHNIYLATGDEPDDFPPMAFIKGIVGKEPPAWLF